MIKKFILLTWYEKQKEQKKARTFRKNGARFRRHGFAGMMRKIHKEHQVLEEDYVAKSILTKRYERVRTRFIFGTLFLCAVLYMLLIKSELYESRTAIIVKDMQTGAVSDTLGLSLLGMGSSSQLQDSKIVETYLQSLDVYMVLDNAFNLTAHYKSDAFDRVSRLSMDATQEEVLAFYNEHLSVDYDEISGILHIAFASVEADKAQKVLSFLVQRVETQINRLNRIKAKKKLSFIEKEFEKAKSKMNASSNRLETYQNKHLLLDPKSEATMASGIISQLEATLLEKEIEYRTMAGFMKEDNYELQAIKKEIDEIKHSISKERKTLTGSADGRLNKILFEYEKLKLALEFDTEVYKNALIQLETTKIDVLKEAKTLSIVSKPNLPDGYTYPNKPKMFITLLMITFLFYGIFTMLGSIIQDHKE